LGIGNWELIITRSPALPGNADTGGSASNFATIKASQSL